MANNTVVYALTLHRPWPYAIFCLGKDIENRTWPCPLPTGSPLVIHAGKKWDEEGANFCQRMGFDVPPEPEHPTGLIGFVRVGCSVRASNSRWFFGPYGWELSACLALPEPIPCPGKQGLWGVPVEIGEALQNKGAR